MDDDADAKMILTTPPPENWNRPPGRPRITWLNTVQRALRSSICGSEPPSVEADHTHGAALSYVRCMQEKNKYGPSNQFSPPNCPDVLSTVKQTL